MLTSMTTKVARAANVGVARARAAQGWGSDASVRGQARHKSISQGALCCWQLQVALILAKNFSRLDPEIAGKFFHVKRKWKIEEKACWDMLEAVREQEVEDLEQAMAQMHEEPNLEELDLAEQAGR